MINEKFIQAPSQFGFQSGIAVTQALLQGEDNARAGMHHEAVLDEEKACDKVEGKLILEVVTQWLDKRTTNTISALLKPFAYPSEK